MKKINLLCSIFLFLVISSTASADGNHVHSHDHEQSHQSAVGKPVAADYAQKVVKVDMLDSMRFVFHNEFVIKAGQTIRFDVTNRGLIRHEFSIGNAQDQAAHAKHMMDNPDMVHGDGEAAITVEPGETKTLTWLFEGEEQVVFACTLPGHYQAGMLHRQDIVN